MDTTPEAQNPTVSVIGLGAMGGGMAQTLVRAGWKTVGYDPSPQARQLANDAGVSTVEDIGQLAGANYFVLSLPSAKIVEKTVPVLLSYPGTRGIIDTTTSHPDTSRALAKLAEEHGAGFVDAPVSGGRTGALAGTLASFVGGSDAAVETSTPILETLTSGKWRRIGESGAGNVVKLLNNVLSGINLLAVAEALDVAASHGLDVDTALAAINTGSGASTASQAMFPKWVTSGTYDSGFALGLQARDMTLALEVAKAGGSNPTLIPAAEQAWRAALEKLTPATDFTLAATVFATGATAFPRPKNS